MYPGDVYLEMRTTWNDGEVCRRKQKYFAKIVIAMEIVAGTVERVLAFPSTANDRRDAHRTDSWVHCYWRRRFIVGAHLLITISQIFIWIVVPWTRPRKSEPGYSQTSTSNKLETSWMQVISDHWSLSHSREISRLRLAIPLKWNYQTIYKVNKHTNPQCTCTYSLLSKRY